MKGSRPVIRALRKRFSNRFAITVESQNKFEFNGTVYSPDLVFRDKETKQIKVIIEVEQGARKSIVGGVITADYCMGREKQSPIMLILALKESDRVDYLKRLPLLFSYKRSLKDIDICCRLEIEERIEEII